MPLAPEPRLAPLKSDEKVRPLGKFFCLNSEKFFLKGVTYGPFALSRKGVPFPEGPTVELDFALMSELGVNSFRTFTPAPKWGIAAGYTYTRSDYQGPMPFIGETRKDDYHAVDASLTYLYSRNLSFRAELLVSRNNSNIPLFEVPREIYALKARYEFK